MNTSILKSAIPTLASRDLERTRRFYENNLGFRTVYCQGNMAIVARDNIEIHFWKCEEDCTSEEGCRINVENIEPYYHEIEPKGILHKFGKLEAKPWGFKEFYVVDDDNNLIKFVELIE